MKKLLLFAFILVSLNSLGQLTIEGSTQPIHISSDWIQVKTITQFMGDAVVNDSVMYTFDKIPDKLRERFEIYVEVINDTSYHYTHAAKADLYRSRKILIYQKRKAYVEIVTPNNDDEIIEKALRKARQMDITNNDVFFGHGLIFPIVNPIADTIE